MFLKVFHKTERTLPSSFCLRILSTSQINPYQDQCIYRPVFSMDRDENSQRHACTRNSRTHQKGNLCFMTCHLLSYLRILCSMISYLKFGPMIKYVCFAKYLQENKDKLTIGRNYQPVTDKALKF